MNNSDKEILEWNLSSYGNVIRGDEDTSEDQVANAVTPEMADLLVIRFNKFQELEVLSKKLELCLRDIIGKYIVADEYTGNERENHISAHLKILINDQNYQYVTNFPDSVLKILGKLTQK